MSNQGNISNGISKSIAKSIALSIALNEYVNSGGVFPPYYPDLPPPTNPVCLEPADGGRWNKFTDDVVAYDEIGTREGEQALQPDRCYSTGTIYEEFIEIDLDTPISYDKYIYSYFSAIDGDNIYRHYVKFDNGITFRTYRNGVFLSERPTKAPLTKIVKEVSDIFPIYLFDLSTLSTAEIAAYEADNACLFYTDAFDKETYPFHRYLCNEGSGTRSWDSGTATKNHGTTKLNGVVTDINGTTIYPNHLRNASNKEGFNKGLYSDGTKIITFDDLTGIHITEFQGTAMPMIDGDDITLDKGFIINLELSDGSVFPLNGDTNNIGGGVERNHQGLIWDNVLDIYERTGTIGSIPVSQSAGDANLPIQSQMKRCLLNDDGTVNYYLDPNDSTKKADGTAADLTGADGQVMVEIPKFYYKAGYSADRRFWSISIENLDGYEIHPAFIKDTVEVDFRYYSAYEGSMWDASTGAMCAKADIITDLYAAGDKMCSVSGQWPKVNETRSEYRTMAAERGTGWRQLDYYLHSAVQLLYLIEYADFNSQAMIGAGRTTLDDGSQVADSFIGKTGYSNADGNASGNVSNGGSAGFLTDYMTYRGIENLYGNVWKMVDGLTIDGRWTGVEAAMPMYATNE